MWLVIKTFAINYTINVPKVDDGGFSPGQQTGKKMAVYIIF